jgi:hypothetical protein
MRLESHFDFGIKFETEDYSYYQDSIPVCVCLQITYGHVSKTTFI